MRNKDLFIEGYLERIMKAFNLTKDKAFEVFAISAIIDKPFQEVKNDIIVPDSDGGIDGATVIQQGYSYTLKLFQCKNKLGLVQREVEKFVRDSEDTFIHGKNRLNADGLKPIIEEYRRLTKDGNIISLKLYFAYNGINSDPTHNANEQIFKHYNGKDNLEIWDADALFGKIDQLIKSQNNRQTIDFTFHPESSNFILPDSSQQAIYTYTVENVRAANFRLKAMELCELVGEEHKGNNTDDFLFSENIRGWLGLGKRPNKRMHETLQNPNHAILFPLLNNGVTIICEKLEIPGAPQHGQYVLKAKNPIIVNGQQTTKVLYDVYINDKSKLNNVYVNVRIYETQDKNLIDKITDATNTQTTINYRDKISNKPFSEYTKEVFANYDVAYITKRGETFSNKISKETGQAVESETVLKYWYATFYEKPESAKSSKEKVLETIYDAANSDNDLKQLFNGDINSNVYKQLYYSYLIYQCVQEESKKRRKKHEFLAHASELLAYGIYKKIERDLSEALGLEKLKEAYEYAFKKVQSIVRAESNLLKNLNREFSYNNYFKKPKCRLDYNAKAKIIENDEIVESLLKIKIA